MPMSDTMVIPTQESQQQPNAKAFVSSSSSETESATCECCGLTEECTPGYIERIRERYLGRWICGLCAEAIKDEIVRSKRLISTEEAVARHTSFFSKFKSDEVRHVDPAARLVSAMRHILRRSLDSPRGPRSTPSSPTSKTKGLARSESCFSTLSGGLK